MGFGLGLGLGVGLGLGLGFGLGLGLGLGLHPMKTTLVTARPKVKRATATCATISTALRLRSSPIRPVSQKLQPCAQPTCDEMHRLYPSSLASCAWASSRLSAPPSLPSSRSSPPAGITTISTSLGLGLGLELGLGLGLELGLELGLGLGLGVEGGLDLGLGLELDARAVLLAQPVQRRP